MSATGDARRTRPLILGEAPADGGDPDRPLSGRPATRLCAAMGWDAPDPYVHLRADLEPLNAVRTREDAYPWSVPRARARMDAWVAEREAEGTLPPVVVCLGRRAAAALRLDGISPYEFIAPEPGDPPWAAVMLPHPSGRNRAWNDPLTARHVRDALTLALDLAHARVPA